MTITKPYPAIDRLAELDRVLNLSSVRFKLAHPEEGNGWSDSQLDLAELEYRKFLAMCAAYPDDNIVPCEIVDKFWHQHILDTRSYREDCERIFGFFYDHYPYFGMNGPEDAANLEAAYETTLDRYHENFGAPPVGAWGDKANKCRTGCKPMKCR